MAQSALQKKTVEHTVTQSSETTDTEFLNALEYIGCLKKGEKQ